MTDELVEKVFKDRYNFMLHASVWMEHWKYDEKDDYDPPKIMVEKSLKHAKYLVECKKALTYSDMNRKYGASYDYFSFRSDHLTEDREE